MDKNILRQALLEKLQADLDMLSRAALMAREEATHEESKATTKYETHGQEAAYLAESQANLAGEIRDNIEFYKTLDLPAFEIGQPVAVGAVITLELRGKPSKYFLGPRNGGVEFAFQGETIMIVTPQSPLGSELLGKYIDDVIHLPGRSFRVAAIE
ncbi:transcription elongation GreA/GreB family factor [Ereboglobus sp. PH5-5]|uniref:transcription elongation factor n=1 Tax=Ereboglobus sp. PH5-5 TaxID=2940529 RepID=UPI00240591D3|nr:transcription elongation factor [Ereboglobus sp. PH5-5]MDF9832942.1 transcription elongation GreA/GreB family factor [Ereboglobus sp. PH5-5]